jgi:predicted Zn-ribbon and HTH transcriptional regulator
VSIEQVTNKEISEKILEILSERKPTSTICPSEVARALAKEDWRDLMDQVRSVADHLQQKGKILVTQRGKSIASATEAKGPIRLKRKIT